MFTAEIAEKQVKGFCPFFYSDFVSFELVEGRIPTS